MFAEHAPFSFDLSAFDLFTALAPGAAVWVVGDGGRAVTRPGEVGELFVAGDCVTPGYWRRAGDPAERFRRRGMHPTGDLVSSEEDGRLVFRGRRDRMVKVAGYRIELGGTEAAVLQHPDVAEAAVVLARQGPEARLRLFFTLRGGAAAQGLPRIRQHCAQRLPGCMVPHTATCPERLPTNANGKIDYRRLTAHPSTAEPTGPAQ